MITIAQLQKAETGKYQESATAWKNWADAALEHAGYVNDNVSAHITTPHWSGMTSALARDKVGEVHANITASATRLRHVETVLTEAGEAFGEAKKALDTAMGKVTGEGFVIKPDVSSANTENTEVTVPEKMYEGRSTPSQNQLDNLANGLETDIRAALYRADRADSGVTYALNHLGPPGGNDDGGNGKNGKNGNGYTPTGSSDAPMPPGPGAPAASGQVKDWIDQALKLLQANGVDISGIDPNDIATIIQYESGGNPNAINNWDSNAAAGTPSMGLMQTIGPTFNSNALPGHTSVYNPVDNIAAGVQYALHRYGSISNVPGIRNLHSGGHYVGY